MAAGTRVEEGPQALALAERIGDEAEDRGEQGGQRRAHAHRQRIAALHMRKLVRDDAPSYYVYRMNMAGRVQTGIALAGSVRAYEQHRIKRKMAYVHLLAMSAKVELIRYLQAKGGLLIGNVIKSQFLNIRDWPFGAATSITLTLVMGLMLLLVLSPVLVI